MLAHGGHAGALAQRLQQRHFLRRVDAQQGAGEPLAFEQQGVEPVQPRIHAHAQVFLHCASHRQPEGVAAAVQKLHLQRLPRADVQPLRQVLGQQQALGRQFDRLQIGIEHAPQLALRRQPLHRTDEAARPVAQPHRAVPHPFDGQHARQAGQFGQGAAWGGLGENQADVLALHQIELHPHDFVDGTGLQPRQDQNPARQRDAQHRKQRAPRVALQLARHHARRRRQPAAGQQPFAARVGKARRAGRAHGLGRGQPPGAPQAGRSA